MDAIRNGNVVLVPNYVYDDMMIKNILSVRLCDR